MGVQGGGGAGFWDVNTAAHACSGPSKGRPPWVRVHMQCHKKSNDFEPDIAYNSERYVNVDMCTNTVACLVMCVYTSL